MKYLLISAILIVFTPTIAKAYTDFWDDIRSPFRSDAEMDAALQADGRLCDRTVGVQKGPATRTYKKCMLKHDWKFSHAVRDAASSVTVYDHDSPDPDIGWHWEDGMRTCHNDCENPEIPGSGFTCRDTDFMGIPSRECDSGH